MGLSKKLHATLQKIGHEVSHHVAKGDKLVKAKSKRRTIDAGVDAADWTAIDDTVATDLIRQFEAAARVEVEASGTDISFSVFNEAARTYAEERGAELVTDISNSTREMLRSSIAEAIENGQTNSQFAKDLMDEYAFSEERALTIARTELAFADVAGHKESSSKAGAIGKRWLLSADHDFDDECNENADDDVILWDENFSGGDDFPPSHPNCQCDFQAIYADDPEAEDLIDEEDNSDEFDDGTEKVLKYTPDQPRDERGRFGSGSGGAVAQERVTVPTISSDTTTQQRFQARVDAMERYLGTLGFQGKLEVTTISDKRTLDGKEAIVAGTYLNGTITMNAVAIKEAFNTSQLYQTLRHEASHARLDLAYKDKSSGVRDYIEKNRATLKRDDGTTTYSKSFWSRKADYKLSVDESLAEMHATERVVGSYAGLNNLIMAHHNRSK